MGIKQLIGGKTPKKNAAIGTAIIKIQRFLGCLLISKGHEST